MTSVPSPCIVPTINDAGLYIAKPDAAQPPFRIRNRNHYNDLHEESLTDPHSFWDREASNLHWMKDYTSTISPRNEDPKNISEWEWFSDGMTNISYNCLDRHVLAGKGNRECIRAITEGGSSTSYTYSDVLDRVSRLANSLSNDFGLATGDRVLIYLPLGLEAIIAMQACVRIGAIHSVVFGGFSSSQIAIRASECQPKLIITADGIIRKNRPLLLKKVVHEALGELVSKSNDAIGGWTADSVKVLSVASRDPAFSEYIEQLDVNERSKAIPNVAHRDFVFHKMLAENSSDHKAVPLPSEHPSFILYTSGSTGLPKGVYHSTAGYMLGAYSTCKYVFDLSEDHPNQLYWCTADVGWITGHTYVAYGPLLMGASQLVYEGGLTTPSAARSLELIDEHNVTVWYTAPTLLRTMMSNGVEPKRHDLRSLRILGTVGEPINSTAWAWYFKDVGGGRCPIVDTWWQTETGSNALTPIPGAIDLRPGCATVPFFGIDPILLNDEDEVVPTGKPGRLHLRKPWPSMLRGIWGREHQGNNLDAFKKHYIHPTLGYYDTGDMAIADDLGYFTITGRADDQINVSGHRIGTAEIESVVCRHPMVAKCAVIAQDDAITGQCMNFCVVPSSIASGKLSEHGSNAAMFKELAGFITKEYGPHARPKMVYVLPAFPETKSGKTMRSLMKSVMNLSGIESPDEKDGQLNALAQRFATMDKDQAEDQNEDMLQILRTCLA